MGDLSTFEGEDIVVTDKEGLRDFLLRWKPLILKQQGKPDRLWEDNIYNILFGGEFASFERWDEIKLISYWYENELIFLRLIAKYITGYVKWSLYGNDVARVSFEDGKCEIRLGKMQYDELTPEELLKGKPEDRCKEIKEFMISESI